VSVEQQVREILLGILDAQESDVVPDARLAADLGVESIEMVDIVVECESRFRISIDDDDLPGVKTVQDVVDLVRRLSGSGASA
jgi:acyl carrier protein